MGLATSAALFVSSSEGAIPGPLLALIGIIAWAAIMGIGLVFVAVVGNSGNGGKKE
jgi:hypothetical protein